MVWEGCLEDVGRLSWCLCLGCRKVVWWVWRSYLEGKGKLSGWCWGVCLEGVGRMSGCVGRLTLVCGVAVWCVWEAVSGCVEAIWRVCRGCLGVWAGCLVCGEAV